MDIGPEREIIYVEPIKDPFEPAEPSPDPRPEPVEEPVEARFAMRSDDAARERLGA